MARRFSAPTSILSNKQATGVGTAMNVRDYRHVLVAVSADANSSLTFKFSGSIAKSATDAGSPDFSLAQAIDNHWDYVAFYDIQNSGSLVAGDTGVTLNNDTVANNTRLYVINTDYLSWLNVEVTAYTDGGVSAFAVGAAD